MKKPNIVFILADDMGQWAMGCSGNDDVLTPNLDKLALEGTRFDNFFCASPVCSPARASILTGSIPSEHGVHDYLSHGNLEGEKRSGKFVTPKKYIEHLTSYTELLKQDGYRCALSADPDEKNNLIKNEKLKPIMQKMRNDLMNSIENYSTELYRCDGIKNTGVGQAYSFDVNKSKDSFVAIVGYKNYLKAYAHRWRFRNYKV
ncbi:MAG: sulfatase-like hydrolase/transferase [Clostridia bacterium]